MSDKASAPEESSRSPLQVALPSSSTDWRQLVAVIFISVTTILTAWTAFQASKWGGSISISFRQTSVQIALFTQWLSAKTTENEKLAGFLRDSFPEPLATATSDWLDERAADAQAAPQTPFDMSSYVLDNAVRAEEKQAQAEQLSAQALTSNRNRDNCTV